MLSLQVKLTTPGNLGVWITAITANLRTPPIPSAQQGMKGYTNFNVFFFIVSYYHYYIISSTPCISVHPLLLRRLLDQEEIQYLPT